MLATTAKAARAFALATGLAAVTTPVVAQSLFGCSDLGNAHVPSIEGDSGVFYRIDPDLLTFHRMTQNTVADVAVLSDALALSGTRLIFVPLPTKALAMPFAMGPDAQRFAYDIDLAATMYDNQLVRLTSRGVTVVDARRAFLDAGAPEAPFFKTDPRVTNIGLQVLAKAIAKTVGAWPYENGPGFVTKAKGTINLASLSHLALQLNCLSDLPEVATMAFETVAKGANYAMENQPRVVFAGSGYTTDSQLNLGGFLSEAAGERVGLINGGDDTLAGLVSYLMSEAYLKSPPEVLIWEVPVASNLAIGGDQPMREALAAVGSRCIADLNVDATTSNRLRVVLSDVNHGPQDTLFLDNSAARADRAVFHFVSTDGRTRTRVVKRAEALEATGRFYMPLTALWEEGAAYVDIETAMSDVVPSVTLCRGSL